MRRRALQQILTHGLRLAEELQLGGEFCVHKQRALEMGVERDAHVREQIALEVLPVARRLHAQQESGAPGGRQ